MHAEPTTQAVETDRQLLERIAANTDPEAPLFTLAQTGGRLPPLNVGQVYQAMFPVSPNQALPWSITLAVLDGNKFAIMFRDPFGTGSRWLRYKIVGER